MNETLVAYVKRLLKHSSIYGVGTLLYRAVALILLPLYTRYLSTGEYGDLELFFITSSFLVMILQFGMGSAIFRAVIYRDQHDPVLIVSTAFFFMLLINLVCVFGLCLFSRELSIAIFEVPDQAYLLRLIFVTDFFLVMSILPMAKLRIDERSLLFTIVAAGNFFCGVTLTVLFLVVFQWGIEGIFWAQLINAIIFTIVYISIISHEIRLKFSWNELKDMLGYGLPLVPASVATSILMLSNRYFLRHLGTAEEVGIFSAGYRMAQIVALIVNAFQMAWPTLLFTIVKEEKARDTFSRLFSYFVFVLVTVSLAIAIFGRELLVLITTPNYVAAHQIIPVLLLSNILWGFFYMTSVGIQVKKKTIYSAIIIGIAALVNLVLNYWLISIPDFRLAGAALASFVANFIVAVATLIISLRFYYIHYEYLKILQIFLLATLAYMIGLVVPTDRIFITLILKTMIIILFLVSLYLGHFFTAGEIDRAKAFLKMIYALVTRPKVESQGR